MATSIGQRREALKQRKLARERFTSARKVERSYKTSLLRISSNINDILRTMVSSNPSLSEYNKVIEQLNRYSDYIRPWATAVAERMVKQVGQKDIASWNDLSHSLGYNLRKEIEGAPTGEVMRSVLSEQVNLITSLPANAAKEVHRLTIEALSGGARAESIVDKIINLGAISAASARRIARTEVSRTSAVLTEARAKHIGSEGYIWHTAGDNDVRDDHKELNGKFIKWSEPPIADKKAGVRAHAGCIYNCRCWAEPILPDIIQ